MSRSRKQPSGAAVSLFPFLAVLLCTMGALVMLLVATAHVSRTRAHAAATAPETPPPIDPEELAAAEKRREQLAEIEAFADKLEAERKKLEATLEEDRLRLGQIEDHIRRQNDKLASLRAAIAELIEEDAQHYDDRALAERNLKQLEELIAETKQEIAELEEEAKNRPKAYAIVPYHGKSGTQRPPIYIECVQNAVIIQPEGVELGLADFQEPLGSGNPLAAALRASREYHLRNNPDAGYDPDAEPYPLILVRPEGSLMLGNVRRAIRSWDSGFGYQLVESEWKLKYPPPNPALFHLQSRAVDNAREARARLARAAPSAYRSVRISSAPNKSEERSAQSTLRSIEETSQELVLGNDGSSSGAPRDSRDPGGGSMSATRTGSSKGTFAGDWGGDSAEGQASHRGAYSPGSDAHIAGVAVPTEGSETSFETGRPQQPAGLPGSVEPSVAPSEPGAGASPFQGGEAATAGSRLVGNGSSSTRRSGEGWWDNQPQRDEIAIRRSVRVRVSKNELVVLPAGAGAPSNVEVGKRIPLDGPTSAALQQFAMAVRTQVRTWGIAGQGLYWRPVIKLDVTADGYRREQDLIRLLQKEGIEVSSGRTATLPASGGPNATR